MAELSDYLNRLSDPALEALVEPSILKATSSALSTNRKAGLVQLVLLRYGTNILSNSRIRQSIIDSLDIETIERISRDLNFPDSDSTYEMVANHFRRWTSPRAKQFLSVLDLPERYDHRVSNETREDKFWIKSAYGETSSRRYLHDFQKRIKDKALKNITSNEARFMIHMPTGSGKTATALELAVDVFRSPGQKKLITWIVNNETLAEQAIQTFSQLWAQKGDRELQAYRLFNNFSPEFDTSTAGFVCTTFQKLMRSLEDDHQNNDNVLALVKNTSILIVDEAHTSTAERWFDVIDKFMQLSGTQLIGLSATPARSDDEESQLLTGLYGYTLVGVEDSDGQPVENAISFLQSGEYLAKINHIPIETYIDCHEVSEALTCQALSENPERNQLIVNQMADAVALEQPTLVFACTKDHVFALTALARNAGIRSELIVGETEPSERERILDSFKSGELPIIINHEILATGVDVPNVRRILITRPVGSPVLYSQIIGRALRGKLNGGSGLPNTVISMKDNISEFHDEATLFDTFLSRFFS